MKLFGRNLSTYIWGLRLLPCYAFWCVRCCLMFRRPFSFLRHYITLQPLPEKMVELRGGLKILLSDHPHDLITVFLIFVRRDYGRVRPGSVVVDIGSNIGTFALYAAHCGAAKVLAYEPNREAFALLQRNIAGNRLQDVIVPHRLAVSERAGETLRFSVKSSPYNAALTGESAAESDPVQTTDFASILRDHGVETVDLLKVDCEGAEYGILLNLPEPLWPRIRELRMEYHPGDRQRLVAHLQARQLKLTLLRQDDPTCGNMWFARS
ncbi:MAG: FkbM family methyltransferase [Verrucomicrobia bacterium]|nr:FkbM family methyltransferase [Verrucomicrobiota bacterium]